MSYFDTLHTNILTDILARFRALVADPMLEDYEGLMLSEVRALMGEVTEVTHSRRPQIDTDPQSFTYGAMLGEDCPIREWAEVIYWDLAYEEDCYSSAA
jgi:hypothetical protein